MPARNRAAETSFTISRNLGRDGRPSASCAASAQISTSVSPWPTCTVRRTRHRRRREHDAAARARGPRRASRPHVPRIALVERPGLPMRRRTTSGSPPRSAFSSRFGLVDERPVDGGARLGAPELEGTLVLVRRRIGLGSRGLRGRRRRRRRELDRSHGLLEDPRVGPIRRRERPEREEHQDREDRLDVAAATTPRRIVGPHGPPLVGACHEYPPPPASLGPPPEC